MIVSVMTTLNISVYTQVVFKSNCSVCILVAINEFFSYWTHKFLRCNVILRCNLTCAKSHVTQINQTYVKLHFNSQAM